MTRVIFLSVFASALFLSSVSGSAQTPASKAEAYYQKVCKYELHRYRRVLKPGSQEGLEKLCFERAVARKSKNMRNELRAALTWCQTEKRNAITECHHDAFGDNQKFGTAFKGGQEIVDKRRAAFQKSLKSRQQFGRRGSRASATPPVKNPVLTRLTAALTGKSVSGLSIRGLKPGIGFQEAKATAERRWGYSGGSAADVFKEFAPNRRDLDRYKRTEGHDGGILKFSTMSGKLGEITYMEHYTSRMDIQAVQTALKQRFGTPTEQHPDGKAIVMAWKQGGTNLRITAGDRIATLARSRRGYWSSIEVALRSQAYTDYLKEAERHCAALRNKPMSQLSVNDRTALMKGCKTP